MRTFYLKTTTKTALITELKTKGFDFESSPLPYTIKNAHGATAVWHGQIPDTFDEYGNILTYKAGYHADVLAPDSWSFTCEIQPVTPNHKFF